MPSQKSPRSPGAPNATFMPARSKLPSQRRPAMPNDETTPSPARVAAFKTGLSAESRAAAYLVAKGYRIMARRFRSGVGEIDIIARRRNTIVFVEVKARASLNDAAYAVTAHQQARIIAAAEAWI